MTDLLIAEDLLLALLEDANGAVRDRAGIDLLLGGAMLSDLNLLGLIELGKRSSFWRPARVRVVPGTAPADQLLRRALDQVADKPRGPAVLVTRVGRGLTNELTGRLTDRGILQRIDGRALGIFPRTTWPARDAAHEKSLRLDLTRVLVDHVAPTPRTAAVIALLSAVGKVHRVVAGDRRQVSEAARPLREADWVATAVKRAVDSAAASAASASAAAASSAAAAGGVP
jgi:hypothetical protein